MKRNFGLIKITILFLFFVQVTYGQNVRFVNQGTIEYEKRVNMYAKITKRINKSNSSWMKQIYDEYKRTQPQFQSTKATLSFSSDASLYEPAEANPMQGNNFLSNDPTINLKKVIYTDFKSGISTSEKNLYEETFLVEDTTRKIQWKITDETREIAGYDCRRANALVMDSIYVVAFYTDQIPVSGGPESFTGLPGMILGLALPHENTTWFATKVSDVTVSSTKIVPPKKGKKLTNAGLLETLKASMKDWGDYAQDIFKAMML
ncbi:GLPGLI family protein [Olivibacter ginsenosidimutans]|uniref:GLPGLI family protein n=1 Tax=Olivibacter ginsenosidimutans TaxID=1176537 RepID=A0ABP9BL92_9SPHI